MRYYIKILFTLEKNNIIHIIIDILCLSLGLIVGIIFLSQASSAYENTKLNQKYMSLDNYMICVPSIEALRISKSNLSDMQTNNIGIKDIQVLNRINDEIVWYNNNFCPSINVMAVTNGYLQLFQDNYLHGENITDSKSAIIGKKAADYYNISIGDKIEITNHSFCITGILEVPQYNESIFVLADALEDKDFYDCQYYIEIEEDNSFELIQFLENNYGRYEIYASNEYMAIQEERLLSGWSFSIMVTIVTLCYGMINIFNIEKFFILKQKKNIAILRALGASKNKIIMTKLLRSMIIAWISSSITAVIVLLLEHTPIGQLLEFHITFTVYLISFFMIAIIYILFSYVLYKRHYDKEISKIVSEI